MNRGHCELPRRGEGGRERGREGGRGGGREDETHLSVEVRENIVGAGGHALQEKSAGMKAQLAQSVHGVGHGLR